MMLLSLLLLLFSLSPATEVQQVKPQELTGAWETQNPDGTKGLLIVDDRFFALTFYKSDPPQFISTEGGKWEQAADGTIKVQWEFNTRDRKQVGQEKTIVINPEGNTITYNNTTWKQIDKGSPGALKGAWLITGRMQNNEMGSMTPGARKTMKILSGSRFQWIAYNSETGEFFGTGGGAYTTKGGKYIENIHFFSRDNSRVGASLEFDFKLEEGKWHHSGKNSKGEPLYEIWATRQSIGI